MKILHTPLRAVVLASLMAIGTAPAIAQPADQTAARPAVDVTDNDRDRDGFDWGLLGLLGLLGLIPRKQHHVVDRDPARPNQDVR